MTENTTPATNADGALMRFSAAHDDLGYVIATTEGLLTALNEMATEDSYLSSEKPEAKGMRSLIIVAMEKLGQISEMHELEWRAGRAEILGEARGG